eukprot:jgi/Tetstr1/460036/TSEL_005356.t1
MSGFSEIRLYQNTTNTVPTGTYTVVTSDFIDSATATIAQNASYEYEDGQKTVSGLSPGTAYWFWVELIDSAGNSSGIQPIGSQETPSVTAIDGSLATVTSTNTTFDKDLFSADYIFDGSFLWDNHIFASPENTPPVTITFTLSQPKKIVGFRVYSATRLAENEPHSFPGTVTFYRGVTELVSKSLQPSDWVVGETNAGATVMRNDYADVFFENTQASSSYAINCTWYTGNLSTLITIVELVLYEGVNPLPIPALTDYADQGYTITESSNAAVNYLGWRAFDRISGASFEAWVADPAETVPHFLGVQLPGAVTVTAVRLWITGAWDHILVEFCKVQGSHDGSNWDTLAVFTNMVYTVIPSGDKATNTFFQEDFDSDDIPSDDAHLFQGTVTNTVSYSHYRLFFDVDEGPPPRFSEVVFLA